MKKPQTSMVRVVNIVGLFGYLSSILQWLWLGVIFMPAILENDLFKKTFLPSPTHTEPTAIGIAPNSPLIMLIAGIITAAMIAVTIHILLTIPKNVAKTGHKITTEIAQVSIPIITHHTPVSAPKNKLLIFKVSFAIKFIVVALAFLLLLLPLQSSLDTRIIWLVGGVLAAVSTFWFGLQLLLAQLLRVSVKDIL